MSVFPAERSRPISFVSIAFLPFVCWSCASRLPAVTEATPPPELQEIAASLDEVAAGVAEFGTVGISSPLLVSPPTSETRNLFAFTLEKNADNFFADAKTEFQGRAAEFEQIVQSLAIGADVALDPTIAAAYAAQLTQYYQAQTQSLQRQGVISEKLRLQNQAAAATRDQEKATAEQAYQQAVAAAKGDPAKLADAKKTRDEAITAADLKYANALQAPEAVGLPTFPTPSAEPKPADKTVAKPPSEARGLLAPMTGFGGLLTNKTGPTLSDRSAIITAAGDNATKAIFSVLGDPTLATQFEGRVVVFGVSMVSVNPGWRTRRGYAADVAVTVRYGFRNADLGIVQRFVDDALIDPRLRRRVAQDYSVATTDPAAKSAAEWTKAAIPEDLKLPEKHPFFGVPISREGVSPLVVAVSPMTETQSLDLSSGNRRQDEFALSLSFALRSAGLGAQAAAFEQFVKSRQQDVATATAAVAVNSYSL